MLNNKQFKKSNTAFILIIIFCLMIFGYLQRNYFPDTNKQTDNLTNELIFIQKELTIQPIGKNSVSYRNRIINNQALANAKYDKKNKQILIDEVQKIALKNGYVTKDKIEDSTTLLEMTAKNNILKRLIIEENSLGTLFLILDEIY